MVFIMLATRTTDGRTGHAKQADSIGAHWPPRFDPHNNRVKGVAPFRVLDETTLRTFRGAIASAEAESPQSTRTTVRVFMLREMCKALRAQMDGVANGTIEAVIPADRVFPGFDLVYFGQNASSRTSLPAVLQEEGAYVQTVLRDIEPISEMVAMARLTRSGYSLGQLTSCNAEQTDQLAALFHEAYSAYTFDITPEAIHEMAGNGNLFLAGFDSSGRIASAMVAEHALISVDGTDVHLYELSDYATFRAHRGNGLMTAMQIEAISRIRALSHGSQSIIFAEDRAPWKAVVLSSVKAGLLHAGTLNKHCTLNGDRDIPEEGSMENLHVFYAP